MQKEASPCPTPPLHVSRVTRAYRLMRSLDRDNTSIENQKAIISDFVARKFPGAELVFYEDRDRSGYTFEQREGYQAMRRELVAHRLDILVVKDFSASRAVTAAGWWSWKTCATRACV